MPFLRREKAISVWALVLLGGVLWLHVSQGATGNNAVTLVNSSPVVTGHTLNNGSPIVLTANGTTTVYANYAVTDSNGCGDVFFAGNVTTTAYRNGLGSSCVPSTLNCYRPVATVHSCPSATSSQTSANVTTTFEMYYLTQATDASSSFPSEMWGLAVERRDGSGAGGTSVLNSAVDVNTLLAIAVTTSTNYGVVPTGGNTSGTNQAATVKNAGNSSTTLNLSGTALTSGTFSIPTSSQHYATSTFTFGGLEQVLNATAQTVSGLLVPRPPLTIWSTSTPFASALFYHGAVAHKGYLYRTGGMVTSTATTTVQFAALSGGGSVGSWSTTTALPSPRRSHKVAVNDNYLYATGGLAASATSTVFFAPLNATGSVDSWTTTTPLPAGLYDHAAVATDNHLYIIGGDTGGSTSTVLFAAFNATGSIGTWTTTTPLPSAIRLHSAARQGNYIYVIGGFTITSTVLFAPINATGSLGAWTTTTFLPVGLYGHASMADNGLLYVAGGTDNAVITSTVLFAPINANSTVGPWTVLGTPLLGSVLYHSAAVHNGYLYSTGGSLDGVNGTSTVQFTSLASRNTYWGIEIPAGTPHRLFTGTNNFTAVFQP